MSTTSAGTVSVLHGTPLYMGPEALGGVEPDASFDVWSLCVVLYEAIAGAHPFAGGGAPRGVGGPDLRASAPDVPARLADFFARVLAADGDLRPRTAGALYERLYELRMGAHRPAAARPPRSGAA